MKGDPLYMQKWSQNFDPLVCNPYDTQIWICLYNLPIEYWLEECLEKIGRSLGTLIEIDLDLENGDLYIYANMKIAKVRTVPKDI
ncbi:hypothetical protein SUGI_1009930 [Cryptomeria japonica]|nr:hypothetical protein SUGI_1009930 [Cryptomeria japonica]